MLQLGAWLPAVVIAAAESVAVPTAAVIAADAQDRSIQLAQSVNEELGQSERVMRVEPDPVWGLGAWVLEPTPWEGERPAELVALVGVIEANGQQYGAAEVYELGSARLLARSAVPAARAGIAATEGAEVDALSELSARVASVVALAAIPAEVISSRRGAVVLNAGSRDGLREGQTLDAYRPGEERVDLETGEIVLGEEVRVGRLVVTRVVEGIAEARVSSGDSEGVRVGTLCRPAIERLPG